MMRSLDKKVFETFEIFSNLFIGFLLVLHYNFSSKSGLMDRVELFKKTSVKSSYDVIEFFAKLYTHFLARYLRAKGTKRSLTTSSPNCGIFIIIHTSSNSLMKRMHLQTLDHGI